MEQWAKQLICWVEPFVKLRVSKMFNLRRDPFKWADENSNTYWDWVISLGYLLYEIQAIVAQQIAAFVQFPPLRSRPRSTWTRCWLKLLSGWVARRQRRVAASTKANCPWSSTVAFSGSRNRISRPISGGAQMA
jgi:hypothetical protein